MISIFLFCLRLLAISAEIGIPYYACAGLSSSGCLSFNFTAFDVNDASSFAVRSGSWSRASYVESKTGKNFVVDVLRQTTSTSATSVCEADGSVLLFKKANGLSMLRPKHMRAKFKITSSTGAAGFVINYQNVSNYVQHTAFRGSCKGSTTFKMGGTSKVDGSVINKPAWFSSAAITIEQDRWYELAIFHNAELVRATLRDLTTTFTVTQSWSDFIVGLLESRGAQDFGLVCTGTCEFDDVVFADAANTQYLSGPLYCSQCIGVTWLPGSLDWCRCCAYACGNVTASYGIGPTSCPGFCTTRCMSESDIDRGYPFNYCSPQGVAGRSSTTSLSTKAPTTTTTKISSTTTIASLPTPQPPPTPQPLPTPQPPPTPQRPPTPQPLTTSQLPLSPSPTAFTRDSPSDGVTTLTTLISCAASSLGCSCIDEKCLTGLKCVDRICVDPASSCQPATLGCACLDDKCLAGLNCVASKCVDSATNPNVVTVSAHRRALDGVLLIALVALSFF